MKKIIAFGFIIAAVIMPVGSVRAALPIDGFLVTDFADGFKQDATFKQSECSQQNVCICTTRFDVGRIYNKDQVAEGEWKAAFAGSGLLYRYTINKDGVDRAYEIRL